MVVIILVKMMVMVMVTVMLAIMTMLVIMLVTKVVYMSLVGFQSFFGAVLLLKMLIRLEAIRMCLSLICWVKA